MGLSFLPEDIISSLACLNYNFLSEIRLRRGQPVIVEYKGEYKYLGCCGLSVGEKDRLTVFDVAQVLNSATNGCIYSYTEQIKSGFITVEHGIRIGIAGEYVTEHGEVNTIKNVTSLNIRVPHEVEGCSNYLFKTLYCDRIQNTLIFSKPGMGKTTMLRDVARNLCKTNILNVLVFDERGEISGIDGYGDGFNLGVADVVRCFSKKGAIAGAIRAMKPDVIITDELYGNDDVNAVEYAVDCGITVIASSHIIDARILKNLPFDYFVKLDSPGGDPLIYDKNFNSYSDCCTDNSRGSVYFGK